MLFGRRLFGNDEVTIFMLDNLAFRKFNELVRALALTHLLAIAGLD